MQKWVSLISTGSWLLEATFYLHHSCLDPLRHSGGLPPRWMIGQRLSRENMGKPKCLWWHNSGGHTAFLPHPFEHTIRPWFSEGEILCKDESTRKEEFFKIILVVLSMNGDCFDIMCVYKESTTSAVLHSVFWDSLERFLYSDIKSLQRRNESDQTKRKVQF